ncbi:MAG TPA: DUF5615 family PIN-like protein [Candidatus Limnocylindria bacterium]|nr:DUF5615 family PIN-like protein [Candidatus Limnocylindria bacterium]
MARGPRLRLLLDEMYPPRFAQALADHGQDALSVSSRADLVGRADAVILAVATQEGRSVVTENARDFATLAAIRSERGQPHAGIILVNPRRFRRTLDGVGGFVAAVDRLAATWPDGIESLIVWLQEPGVTGG